MEAKHEAFTFLYAGTEFGWPVLVVVACLLAFIQAMSGITQEPNAMLYTIDSLILLVTLPFYALTIQVSPGTVHWCLLFGLFPQTLQVASIQAIQIIALSPMDGYGVRGDGAKKLWRVSGSKSVVMELADASFVAFGTTNPLSLVNAIERARSLVSKAKEP